MNFSSLTQIALLAALEAGELLAHGFGSELNISHKEGVQNLVTQYDTASQDLIIKKIKKAFPDHHFLAEEKGVFARPSENILWIIDPLDGTVNFAYNIPFFAVSIAAAKGNEIVTGVVYNPMNKELFIAEKGKGAYLNGKALRVSKTRSLSKALLSTGFPVNVSQNPMHCVDSFAKIAVLGTPIRRMGVASIDLSYVAAGRFDAFWEVRLHPWDMAAGKLLIEEAGGKVTDYAGSPHEIFNYLPLLASNGHLHSQMIKLLK